MRYISTKNKANYVTAARAIAEGIAPDGGLYVPEEFPAVSLLEIASFAALSYTDRANRIMSKFLTDFSEERIAEITAAAYARFDGDPAPLIKTEAGVFFLELWHGPTHAFKDIALTVLPYLLTESKAALAQKERTMVLVATSGDTGKAALAGFTDVPDTDIIVLYPNEGVSALQKLQMVTQDGQNVRVAAVNGNFDDAQTAVKRLFADEGLIAHLKHEGYRFSSANSINFGRLLPQIVYYFSAYADLLDSGEIENGDQVDFCVPTGNFGNILAGYYAKRMGLPVGKLICASNANRVLTDFMDSGKYDIKSRSFIKTSSPSMDILISSNLERLLFELSGRDDALTADRMRQLKDKGGYSITAEELQDLQSGFIAGSATESEVKAAIAGYFDETGYIVDPHTAVALSVVNQLEQSDTPVVILSTASPYKFAGDVLDALGEDVPKDPFKALEALEDITALPVPDSLRALKAAPVRFSEVIDANNAAETVRDYIAKTKVNDHDTARK